jgi:hypothetical protein
LFSGCCDREEGVAKEKNARQRRGEQEKTQKGCFKRLSTSNAKFFWHASSLLAIFDHLTSKSGQFADLNTKIRGKNPGWPEKDFFSSHVAL